MKSCLGNKEKIMGWNWQKFYYFACCDFVGRRTYRGFYVAVKSTWILATLWCFILSFHFRLWLWLIPWQNCFSTFNILFVLVDYFIINFCVFCFVFKCVNHMVYDKFKPLFYAKQNCLFCTWFPEKIHPKPK